MNKCKQCGRVIVSSRPRATARKFCDSTCDKNWKYHHVRGYAAKCRANIRTWRLRNPERAAAIFRAALKRFEKSHPGYYANYTREWIGMHPGRWKQICHESYERRKRKVIKATKSTL